MLLLLKVWTFCKLLQAACSFWMVLNLNWRLRCSVRLVVSCVVVIWLIMKSYWEGENQKAKLSIYQSVDVPTLVYGHKLKLWVVSKRMRSWIQAVKMSFLHRLGRLNLRDKVQSLDILRERRVEALHLHVKRCKWGGSGILANGGLLLKVFWIHPIERRPWADPGHAEEIIYLYLYISGLGTPQDCPGEAGKRCCWERHIDHLAEPTVTAT